MTTAQAVGTAAADDISEDELQKILEESIEQKKEEKFTRQMDQGAKIAAQQKTAIMSGLVDNSKIL